MSSDDERVASVAANGALDRAWGKPKDYDPRKPLTPACDLTSPPCPPRNAASCSRSSDGVRFVRPMAMMSARCRSSARSGVDVAVTAAGT